MFKFSEREEDFRVLRAENFLIEFKVFAFHSYPRVFEAIVCRV